MRKLALLLLFLLLVSQAENYVVVNSMDGRDVLTGIFYANAKGEPIRFMAYPNGNSDVLAMKIGSGQDVLLIQSKTQPISNFLKDSIERRGSNVEIYESTDGGATNINLAARSGAKKFIIVDSAYSDGALSVMSYADLKDAYVILSSKDNAEQVRTAVQNANEVMVYGYVDSAVKQQLATLTAPKITYVGKGEDRYEDNVLISKMLMEEYNVSSVIFTEGTFIEQGMVDSKIPFVLSGRLVPDATYQFTKDMVRQDKLLNSYLISGTTITTAIRDMRERIRIELLQETGMNKSFGIWMRYAQALPSSASANPMALDTFPLPAYVPYLNISEVVYNKGTKNLMVRLDNLGDGPAYFLTDIRVLVDGQEFKVLGNSTSQLIERGDKMGLQYVLDLSSVQEGNVTAVVIAKYGGGKKTLDNYDSYVGPIAYIEYTDLSNVTAKSAKYYADNKTMVVSLKNNKGEIAYASTDIELLIDGETTRVIGPKNLELPPNSLVPVSIPVELSQKDLTDNKEVTAYVQYGARSGYLVNSGTYKFPLEAPADNTLLFIGLGLLLLLILLAIAYYLWKKSRKKEEPQEKKK